MGNAAKRREVVAKLKRLGLPSRIYKGSKLSAYRWLDANLLLAISRVLDFATPGMRVHDCDGKNHTVLGVDPRRLRRRCVGYRRLSRLDFVIDIPVVRFTDGRVSCRCGTSPSEPLTE